MTGFDAWGVAALLCWVFRGVGQVGMVVLFVGHILGIWCAHFFIKFLLFAGFALRAFRNIPKQRRSWGEFIYKVREYEWMEAQENGGVFGK